jgi:hypothetical protein
MTSLLKNLVQYLIYTFFKIQKDATYAGFPNHIHTH